MRRFIDHGRSIVNVRAKGLVPTPLVLVVFVCLISKREDQVAGVKGVIHSKLRQRGAWKECLMARGIGTRGHFPELTAVVDIDFQLSKVCIELGNAGGLEDSGNELKVIIWKGIFFVVPDGYNGLSDTGQQPGHFVDIFGFVVVFDAVAEDSVYESSPIGIIGENKVAKEELEEQGSSLLERFKGCELTLDYLIESRFNVVAEVAVGLFQLIAEGSLCGVCSAIHSGDDGISDVESIVPAGGCYLITSELSVVVE